MKVTAYLVVEGKDPEDLEHRVVGLLRQGYQLLGGVAIRQINFHASQYAQAMVKYEDTPKGQSTGAR